MSPKNSNHVHEAEFGQALGAVEQTLFDLKNRYHQVLRDQKLKHTLEQQQQRLHRQKSQDKNQQQMSVELQQIQQELETIELNLESRLFKWTSLREPFWLIVRFGGLGVVLGWFLKSLAG